jgi:hypothetical protein
MVVSKEVVVGRGPRLTQLSPTPAPSLLSTSASEPFSDVSRSCSEDGAESTVSFATAAGASGGLGRGRGAGAGGSSGAVTEALVVADTRVRHKVL